MAAKVTIPQVSLAPDFTAVITGSHAGVGYEVAKYLALLGARVVLACENETKAKAAMLRIQADVMEMRGSVMELEKEHDLDLEDSIGPSPSELASVLDSPLRLEFMHLDLTSLESVKHFAAQFIEKNYDLHLLVCTDAVINVPKGQTVDGWETHFQYNYLSHMFLTVLLLPTMTRHDADARIVLGSSTHHSQGKFDFQNMQGVGKNAYDSKRFCANSQLYMVMLMHCLERRLKKTNVAVYSIHNGAIDALIKTNNKDLTTWGTIYSLGRSLGKIARNTTKSVSNCLSVSINPALRSLRGSFFVKGLPMSVSSTARDSRLQELLWRYSLDCLGEHVTREDVQTLELTEDQLEDIGIDY